MALIKLRCGKNMITIVSATQIGNDNARSNNSASKEKIQEKNEMATTSLFFTAKNIIVRKQILQLISMFYDPRSIFTFYAQSDKSVWYSRQLVIPAEGVVNKYYTKNAKWSQIHSLQVFLVMNDEFCLHLLVLKIWWLHVWVLCSIINIWGISFNIRFSKHSQGYILQVSLLGFIRNNTNI